TVASKHRHGQDCPCNDGCGMDSRVLAQARTGLTLPRWVWLGQTCPSTGTDRTVRATMHGQDARAT
ncbi:MAG: hypothetical protein NZ556_09080, partial [Fimbriimonadales bacterium]|nr:hypothetical protein [Fimbriimonadales bacterium]